MSEDELNAADWAEAQSYLPFICSAIVESAALPYVEARQRALDRIAARQNARLSLEHREAKEGREQ